MVFTAFSGQILAEMTLSIFVDGQDVQSNVQDVLRRVASTVPSTVAVNWLNWIILRVFVTLPYQYMLQLNSFLFHWLGLKCCSRVVRGGGPGGPVPYRIYVDSGVVFMTVLALAPASPLLAIAALVYFLYFQPLLRRNLIYVYRPRYDGGGLRWPFIFDMCISAMIVGSLLLAFQMSLKEALSPAIMAGFTIGPILVFQWEAKRKFQRAFDDAALLQTSLLDGWNTDSSCFANREEYRRFLVDAHKAAYVPVCMASTDGADALTVQPAVTVPLESDTDSAPTINTEESDVTDENQSIPETRLPQHRRGSIMRRTINVMSVDQRKRALSSGKLDLGMNSIRGDDFSIQSPWNNSSSVRSSFRTNSNRSSMNLRSTSSGEQFQNTSTRSIPSPPGFGRASTASLVDLRSPSQRHFSSGSKSASSPLDPLDEDSKDR